MIKTKPSRRDTLRFSNFGFSTILLSFVMICVVSFSALSLMTAYSDYKLSQKVADKTKLYYEANQRAYDRLQSLDQILCDAYLASYDENAYYSAVLESIASSKEFSKTELNTSIDSSSKPYLLSFEEPISESQHLLIQVSLCYPTDPEDTFYELLQWSSVHVSMELEDEYLNLIQ